MISDNKVHVCFTDKKRKDDFIQKAWYIIYRKRLILMSEKDDLFLIQVRLFRLAQNTWNLDAQACSAIFNKYDVYDYIKTCYGFYHIQGDEANLADIVEYLKNKGAEI